MDDRPVQLTEDEYEHIEETIARSAKGRAFLRRFASLTRGGIADDMRRILDQMRTVLNVHQDGAQAAQHVGVLRRELQEMAASIEHARREIAALRPPGADTDRFVSATNELDAIVISTERASFDILNSAERLMDLGSRLRRAGADAELCSDIETEVTNIFTACSFQDLTGQRTSKVINALRYIEQRINAMIAIWDNDGSVVPPPPPEPGRAAVPDSHLLHGPALPGQGVSQDDVDAMFSTLMPDPAAETAAGDDGGWNVEEPAEDPGASVWDAQDEDEAAAGQHAVDAAPVPEPEADWLAEAAPEADEAAWMAAVSEAEAAPEVVPEAEPAAKARKPKTAKPAPVAEAEPPKAAAQPKAAPPKAVTPKMSPPPAATLPPPAAAKAPAAAPKPAPAATAKPPDPGPAAGPLDQSAIDALFG
ncbi:protein phosphatase CheZ [Arenibaculum pallidiluteum]|uniref:protein phosphatase CheZ n=1 Tax=Arenibaculum pallidiluteum TaxID=2812559 RepID=UPI001A9728FE|nr:protein phosphatase CheZ [Arenibaculum pallidiluteum]